MSQLDLGLTAEVSARHISFLETGRSRPSPEMVQLLGEVLDVPLRSRNELMRAAGFSPVHPEPSIDELLAGPLGAAIDALLEHAEPYPVLVLNRWYDLARANDGGRRLLGLAGVDLSTDPKLNVLTLIFDPALRPAFVNWDDVAGQILRRMQRLVLRDPSDTRLAELLAELVSSSGLTGDWRVPDLSGRIDPTVSVEIVINGVRLRLLTTITVFDAPNNAALEELLIENYLPLDQTTRDFFQSREP